MSPESPLASRSSIVAALRAAGCVFAEQEAGLLLAEARTAAELATLVDRRVSGEPLEHVLGWAEFCGLRILVDPGVFVPRPRTQLLVEQAAAVAMTGAVVVDLCCGSGAVGAALATRIAGLELHAVDVDPAAASCARRNVAFAAGRVYTGDLDAPLPADLTGRVDVLVANAPYVPTGALRLLPAEARLYESAVALDGGADGLDVQRRVAAAAPRWLAPGGHLLVETSAGQATRTAELFAANGLRARLAGSDDEGTVVVVGTLAGGVGE